MDHEFEALENRDEGSTNRTLRGIGSEDGFAGVVSGFLTCSGAAVEGDCFKGKGPSTNSAA